MTNHHPIAGAVWMLLAGLAFTFINTTAQYLSIKLNMPSTTVALFQYMFALIFMLPVLIRAGIGNILKTHQGGWHFIRVLFSVAGIQLWLWSLAYPIPIWQGIALLMTSPLFATLGSSIWLKEQVGWARWIATIVGFIGALIILEPWSEEFTWAALMPVAAAFCWACYSLIVKKISSHDSPNTIVLYLFLWLMPFNLILALPQLEMPQEYINLSLILLIFAGGLTAFAQWAIAKAYTAADASFIQPFDNAKLPMNVLAGWIVFQWVPPGRLWLGAAIIIAAVFFITHKENKSSSTK